MEFRLLGPLEVVVNGLPQRLAGRGVSAAWLIERLWAPENMPADPMNALQIRVSKLRRSLSAWGEAGCLVREVGGYRLAVDPMSVDAERFAALVSVARRIGDPTDGVKAYDDALSLWRAEPFAEFVDEPWTVAESARLTELYMAAVAERAERMLTLGRYEQLVSDLGPVVAGAPTRERLVAQFMTALFNAGRQAEGLRAYGRTRRLLAEELGVDPSRELRQVMEQILRHDAALVPAVARSAQTRAGVA